MKRVIDEWNSEIAKLKEMNEDLKEQVSTKQAIIKKKNKT